jgi:cytochrome P450
MERAMTAKPISFMDPDIQKCPFPTYHKVREQGPVFVDPATGWYVISDYDLVRQLTADTDNLSSFTGILMCKRKSEVQEKLDTIYREQGYMTVPALVVVDPPDHRFHRSFVDKAFTPARLKLMEDYIEGVVSGLIGDIIDKPEVEFRSEFAVTVPLTVIADQLGLPRADMDKMRFWTDSVIANQDQSNSDERQLELARNICELHRYAAAKVEEFRREPRECLLSDFANGVVDGRRLTMEEIAALIEQVLAGGNDSTANAMTNAVLRLIEQPELQEKLHADPSLMRKFIEEVLRLDAPVQGLFREPKRDMEIAGVKIPKGSVVVLKWGAANRDPSQFPEPDKLDIERPNVTRHMTFGFGPHTCVGNQLARMELRISLTRLLERVKNIRLSRGAAGAVRIPHFFAYGLDELYISFDKR